MQRYFISPYTDGPAQRWNVIDRQTQEWVRRFASEQEARAYADRLVLKSRAEQAERRVEELMALGQFLVDRLDEFDPGDDEPEREYHGHVTPAIARFRAALAPEQDK